MRLHGWIHGVRAVLIFDTPDGPRFRAWRIRLQRDRKARILIVEDEAIIALDISQMLQKLGHTILDTVMTGEEAIGKAASLRPDLVLMDIQLAGKIDGITAAVRIREAHDIPVMFLTGNTDEATLERAKAAAPSGYLPKPITERDLRVWVEMGLHKARLERRVRESERYLYSVLSAVDDAVIATDATWKIQELNPAAEELTGWPAVEAIGRPIADVLKIVAADGSSLLDESLKVVLQGSTFREWHGNHWLQRRDGSRIALAYTCTLMKDEDGTANGMVFASRDISDRKEAEKKLHQSEERMRFAMELMETGEWDMNLDARTVHRSLRHDLIFGYETLLPQWTYEMFLEHVVAEDRARVDEAFQAAVAGRKNWDFECRIVRRDGVVRWVRAAGRHCPSESGGMNRLVGIVQDITVRREAEEERKRVEQKLQETQKLESLGVLAGGIAHDFNNLLTGVIGNTSIARMELSPTSSALPLLEGIEEAAMRAADLCKQIAPGGLCRQGPLRRAAPRSERARPGDGLYCCKPSIEKGVVLKFNLADGLPAVSADATQVRQIVMNLVLNASEAIGAKSGFVSISTGLVHANRTYLDHTIVAPDLPEGNYVYLEVSDNGGGMTPETLAKIFDPFFTTKFTGRGLGLAAVLGIVRGHKGTLKVYSELGKGTAFKILIPCSSEASATRARSVHGARRVGGMARLGHCARGRRRRNGALHRDPDVAIHGFRRAHRQ